jgi:hypothetical protein
MTEVTNPVTPHLLYELVGLPHRNVVQNFFVGTSYVYALQLHKNRNSTGYNAYITRARRPGLDMSTKYTIDFTGCPVITMNNFGHGQTLDYFEGNDGTPYLLIATKANPDYSDEHWDIQIARLNFNSARYNSPLNGNTSVTRLAHIKEALEMKNDLKRVGAAVSTNHTTLLIGGIDSEGNGVFAKYKIDTINSAMDEAANGNGVTRLDYIGYDSRFEVPNIMNGLLPQKSIQGFELDNAGNVYVSSGTPNYYNPDDASKIPSVNKFIWGDPTPHTINLRDGYWDGCEIEPEGIQILNPETDMLIAVSYHSGGVTTKNRIYHFDINTFY